MYGIRKRILLFLAGLLLMPVCIGMARAFAGGMVRASLTRREGWVFIGGIAVYFIIHVFFYKPMTVHVFGHEFTHVLWAWLFGGRVKRFHVSKGGGQVIVTKSNIFVRLAPYFFPLYSILTILIYSVISYVAGHHRWFVSFAFVLGLTVGFHIGMTVHSLRVKQPDLSAPGYFFSISFILLMNMAILMFFVTLFFRNVSFMDFIIDSSRFSGSVYAYVGRGLFRK